MHFYIVGILVFALLISIFAVQNAAPVSIKLLFWTFPQIPLVFVVFGTALFGLVAGILLGRHSRGPKSPDSFYANNEKLFTSRLKKSK